MHQLTGPESHDVTFGNLPTEERRELIGSQVDLPGRYPILTDGVMHDLIDEISYLLNQQGAIDRGQCLNVAGRIERFIEAARTKLKGDGRKLKDWKYTVVVAVHHKGQATDFWLGDRPDVERVDKSLDQQLKKPIAAERVKIAKP